MENIKSLKFSKYHLSTDLLDDLGLNNKRIIFSTRTATSILIEEDIYQTALGGKFNSLNKEVFQSLKEKEFIVPASQDEYNHIITSNLEEKDKSNFLTATIQPSANCQLGCHYCGQNHSKHVASDKIIDKYFDRLNHLLFKKDIYNGLAITWYGGEPLTGLSVIRKLSKRLIALCEDHEYSYVADIVTNGVNLKPKLFKELVNEHRITQFQITIDGTAESHDQRRMTKSGNSTFDIITKNIIEVVKTPTYKNSHCNISIRINIDKTNHQYVEPLIDFIKDNGLENSVSVYFAPIVNFGGNDAGSKYGLDKDFFAQKEIEWLFKCYEYGINVNILPERTHIVCMVEKEDSEVYDAFGNIYSCWEFPYSDTYSTGDSLIGNLLMPEETYNKDATLRDWNKVLDSGETWCKTCLHLPICGGGCPKSWHEGTPACPPFKFNYKDKLLLDYYIRNNAKQKKEDSLPIG